jgi:PAS domain S-box-containing protein
MQRWRSEALIHAVETADRSNAVTAADNHGSADRLTDDPFSGAGEIRQLCRRLDWAATPLGPVAQWSATLRNVVRTAMASPFPINLWCGPELVLIYNDAYRPVLGSKHPSALGQPGSQVWAEIWSDIAPMFQEIRDGDTSVYADDAPFVVHRADGEDDREEGAANAWFTFALSPVRDEAGNIVAFLNIVSETTRRVLAERASEAARASAERAKARLREVFAQAPSFMAVLRGKNHVFEYANRAYHQLVGHRQIIGKPVLEALPELRDQGFETLLDTVLETGDPFVGREVSVFLSPSSDSTPVQHYLDFVYYPITEADGSRTGVVAHGSDVTDHVLARQEAQRARGESEKANLAKSQFLANMSHEIRTPINAVIGYADLLDAGVAEPLGARQQQYIDRIRASSRHLLALVNDVLDLSKIEAGEVMIRAEKRGVDAVLDAALHVVAPEADARRLAIHQEWQCDLGTRFLGDEDRVRQIVLNLLSNSLKFTEPGGVVTIRCRMGELPPLESALPVTGQWVIIDIEDSGTGIAEDQLERIFDAFVQVDDSATRRAGGTGLGLAISRRFARLMGGDLTVRSEPGAGSCFSLWLPAAAQDAAAVGAGHSAPEPLIVPAPEDRAGLAAAGQILLAHADRIEEQLVGLLERDPDIATESLAPPQIADHTAALLAVFGRTLSSLDIGGGGVIEDGEAIRDLLADRHGRQRRRIGWQRQHVEREYSILLHLAEAAIRSDARIRNERDAVVALDVLHRLIAAAEVRSLAAFDAAAVNGHADTGGIHGAVVDQNSQSS